MDANLKPQNQLSEPHRLACAAQYMSAYYKKNSIISFHSIETKYFHFQLFSRSMTGLLFLRERDFSYLYHEQSSHT